MSQPRLIILDSNAVNGNLESFAFRVGRSLRAPKHPKVLTPCKNQYQVSTEDRINAWKATHAQALKQLEEGNDVIIAADLLEEGPGYDWAHRLARQTRATLVGIRTASHYGGSDPDDMNPNHEWPFRPYLTQDNGAAAARKVAMEIDRKARRPGTATADGKPVKADLYLVEEAEATRRSVLAEKMATASGGVAIDLDARREKISREGPHSGWADSPHKQNTITAKLWEDVEIELLDALRKGRAVVLAAKDMTDPVTLEVAEMARRVVDGKMGRARLVNGGHTPPRDDGFEVLNWPGNGSLHDQADQLARHLVGGSAEPSFDDLFDLPPADRRRPVMIRPRSLTSRPSRRPRRSALPRP